MLAQTPDQLITSLCTGLEAASVGYALTGAAAARKVAPFVTNILVVHVWVAATVDRIEVCHQIGATPVESGPNVVLLQDRDNTPLAFRARTEDEWLANVFRLYSDLQRDPRRGQEQGEHLRSQVIQF